MGWDGSVPITSPLKANSETFCLKGWKQCSPLIPDINKEQTKAKSCLKSSRTSQIGTVSWACCCLEILGFRGESKRRNTVLTDLIKFFPSVTSQARGICLGKRQRGVRTKLLWLQGKDYSYLEKLSNWIPQHEDWNRHYIFQQITEIQGDCPQVQMGFPCWSQGMWCLFACLFLNWNYFVTVQWLSFQAVLSCFSVQAVLLPKMVKSRLMASCRAPGPMATTPRWGPWARGGSHPQARLLCQKALVPAHSESSLSLSITPTSCSHHYFVFWGNRQ